MKSLLEMARRVTLGSALRAAGMLFLTFVGLYIYKRVVEDFYPVKEWLFWTYAKIWGYCLLFGGAVLSTGHLALKALRVGPLPLTEKLVFTLAAGVLGYFYLMFLGGLLHLYRPWFAVGLPLVMIAAGAPSLVKSGRRAYRHIAAARARGVRARPWHTTPVTVFGALGVALVYYSILSPRNIAFDSHFYHLGIAQQYATEHAIVPFREGWLPGALPHLASILYSWAFILPKLDMFERIVCASHVEFVLFVFTLASIPRLVRYLVPGASTGASWAAMFLFPCLFVYDSSLTTAADHVAAFFAVPAWLGFRRVMRGLTPKNGVLFAIPVVGAMLTKYQSMYLVAGPALAIFGRVLYDVGRAADDRLRKKLAVDRARFLRPIVGLAALGAMGIAMTAPHWLKNWVFYHDPLFPYLHKTFGSTEWVPDEGRLFQDWTYWQTKAWVTQGTTGERLKEALAVTFSFSFRPHDWPNFHGKYPLFGSLFTLSLGLLPFVKRSGRVWALTGATHLGVFVWYYTMHQDRYLQVLLPWMAAVTAATFALAWRTGVFGRAAVSLLVSFQLVWGGDAYLIPAHAMTKAPPLTTTSELVAMGYKKKYEQRFKPGGGLFDIGAWKGLPKDARILMHENNPRLGLWRPVVVDIAGWQYALRYELFESTAAMDSKLRSLGVTHILSRVKKSRQMDSLGADLRFFDFIEQDAPMLKRFGEQTLFEMPHAPPAEEKTNVVAYLGCSKLYERGLHLLSELSVRDKQVQKPPPKKRAYEKSEDPEELLVQAHFAVTDSSCKPAVPASALGEFVKIGKRGKEDLWSRKRVAVALDEPSSSKESDDDDDDGDHLVQ